MSKREPTLTVFGGAVLYEMPSWIGVYDRLPELGQWVNVQVDLREDFWEAYFAKQRGKPLVYTTCACLRFIDSEGHAYWEQGRLASGRALRDIKHVTHWQPLPEPVFTEEEE